MRRKLQTIKLLNAVVAAGAGAGHEVNSDRLGFYIQIVTTATVSIETSPDGATWMATSIAAETASGYFALDELHRFVRANVTAWTAGAVTVSLVESV